MVSVSFQNRCKTSDSFSSCGASSRRFLLCSDSVANVYSQKFRNKAASNLNEIMLALRFLLSNAIIQDLLVCGSPAALNF